MGRFVDSYALIHGDLRGDLWGYMEIYRERFVRYIERDLWGEF